VAGYIPRWFSGLPARRQSPIQVLTGPGVDRMKCVTAAPRHHLCICTGAAWCAGACKQAQPISIQLQHWQLPRFYQWQQFRHWDQHLGSLPFSPIPLGWFLGAHSPPCLLAPCGCFLSVRLCVALLSDSICFAPCWLRCYMRGMFVYDWKLFIAAGVAIGGTGAFALLP